MWHQPMFQPSVSPDFVLSGRMGNGPSNQPPSSAGYNPDWAQVAHSVVGPALAASQLHKQVVTAFDAQGGVRSYTQRIRSVLHGYFGVSQERVASRLLFLLVPYFQIIKNWARPRTRDVSIGEYQSDVVPSGRVRAVVPESQSSHDLYVPVMAFVTYIILYGWFAGTKNEFTPVKLYERASLGLAVGLCEAVLFLIVKTLCPGALSLGLLDVVSITGSKFVHLSAMFLTAIIVKERIPGVCQTVQIYLYIACFVSMLMLYASPAESDASLEWAKSRAKAIPWVLGSASVQVLLCILLSPW